MKFVSNKIIAVFATIVLFCAVFLLPAVAEEPAALPAASSEEAFSIMNKVEDLLAYQGDYSCTVTLVVEKPGKPKENMQYKMFERIGADMFTMVQLFPDADKGNGWLRDGDNIWVYDPIGRRFSHTSLKDALGDSDVKVDDVSNDKNKWQKNYKVTGFSDGKLGQYDVYVITLYAITSEPSYTESIFYVRKDIPLLLKKEDYSAAGRLMRKILIPRYTKVPQGYVGIQSIVRNELNPGEQTQQIISDLTFDKLPDRVFTKAYLEGLN